MNIVMTRAIQLVIVMLMMIVRMVILMIMKVEMMILVVEILMRMVVEMIVVIMEGMMVMMILRNFKTNDRKKETSCQNLQTIWTLHHHRM